MPLWGAPDKVISSGYSGKTQALLRDAKLRAEALLPKVPAHEMRDGEDKSPLALYVDGPRTLETWVTRSKSEDPMVLAGLIKAQAPLSDQPLPDWKVEREVRGVNTRDPTAVFAALRMHQDAVALDMVQRETGRETLRRQLLAVETMPWRREQMEKAFDLERTQAHTLLKQTIAKFEAAVEEYRGTFAVEQAAAERIEKLNAVKRAWKKAAEGGGEEGEEEDWEGVD